VSVAVLALVIGANSPAVADERAEGRPWSVGASTYAYFVPDAPDFIMAIVPIDIRLLHLEGRYNYEAPRSGSVFIGANVRVGEKVKLALTPMFGGVAGDLDGVIPALRFTLTWWKVELTSESEYVFDLDASESSFFYNWSELGIYPLPWLRAGVVIQRSLVFQNDLDIQRGLLVSGTYRFITLTLYELNILWTTPTWVLAMAVSF
jgi:hypothetical protein